MLKSLKNLGQENSIFWVGLFNCIRMLIRFNTNGPIINRYLDRNLTIKDIPFKPKPSYYTDSYIPTGLTR